MSQSPDGLQSTSSESGAERSGEPGPLAEALDPGGSIGLRWHVPVLMVADVILSAASVYAAGLIGHTTVANALAAGVVLVVCWLAAFALSGMYSLSMRHPVMRIFDCSRALFLGTMAAIALTFLLNPGWLAGRWHYVAGFVLATILTGGARIVIAAAVPQPVLRRRVAVFGSSKQVRQIIALLRGDYEGPSRFDIIAAVVTEKLDDTHENVLDAGDDFAQQLHSAGVQVLIIPANGTYSEDVTRRLGECDAIGMRVMRFEAAYEILTQKAPVFNVGPDWIATIESVHYNRYCQRPKRLLDIVATLALMPLALPLIGISALLIRIFSPGPVFYTQTRVGRDGKRFNFTKLRTMIPDAEKHTGPVWAAEDDPRITPIGRFLRKTRLDELPQFFHVLAGDMSLVGPRPERPEFVEDLKKEIPLYEHRLMVRPGITGWAQIHHNYDRTTADVVEKLRYDLYYIRNLCFNLDLQIIVRTIGVMLGKKGAH
ncbi:MAG: sugar transferase [Armatimonadota bacterium]